MKKLFLLSFIFIFQVGFSQEIKENSLLWEISGNGLSQPSYLFGTIHIACQGDVMMTEKMQKAFDQTKSLVLEVNLNDPSAMMAMMQANMATDGKTVTEKLGAKLSEKVDQLLQKKMNTPLSALNQFKIQALAVQLSVLTLECPMDLGFDMMFLKEANTLGKTISGLESVQDQLDLLFGITDEEAIESIQNLINNFEEYQENSQKMVKAYKSEEIQQLYDITTSDFEEENPGFTLEEMLDNRNKNWIPVIEKKIKEEPVFIAVGAGHLAGDNGVINLLIKRGYTIKPVL